MKYFKNSSDKQITDFDLIEPIKQVIGNDHMCVNWTETCGEFICKIQKVGFSYLHRVLTSVMCLTSSMTQTRTLLALHQHLRKPLNYKFVVYPSLTESAVHEFFGKLEVKLTNKILYEKFRHPVSMRITSILNITWFIYIEPLHSFFQN